MDLARFWWSDQAAGPGGIGNSLRFRGAQNLSRTPNVAATDGTRGTFSGWFKLSDTSNRANILINAGNSAIPRIAIQWIGLDNAESGQVTLMYGSATLGLNDQFDVTGVLRDPGAWYHLVLQFDSTQAAAADRLRFFVNGQERAVTRTQGNDVQQNDTFWYTNNGILTSIGISFHNGAGSPSSPFVGYAAEIHTIDGQALAPTDFGEFDNNDVWIPTAYAGTYGANGFHLDFSDPADIGADRSGNGNDFTPNGFELGDNTSVNWDHMEDAPSQNWSVLSALIPSSDLEDGNLRYNSAGTATTVVSTPSTAYWNTTLDANHYYCEFTCITQPGSLSPTNVYGVCRRDADFTTDNTHSLPGAVTYSGDGRIFVNGTPQGAQGSVATVNDGDTVGILYNSNNRQITFFVNNVDQGSVGIGAFADYVFVSGSNSDTAGGVIAANFGQRPFRFAAPEINGRAAVPLQTQNLQGISPIPNGRAHCRVITDTGANILTAAQTAFLNGLWWIKDRDNGGNFQLVDSVRGVNIATLTPARGTAAYAAPAGNSVAWCWNYNAANPAENGFEIIEYTGNGTRGRQIPHQLGQVPQFRMIANQSINREVNVTHVGISDPTNNLLFLGGDGAATGSGGSQNPGDFTDTVTLVGDGTTDNSVDDDFTMYLWAPIPGYSAFGSFEGNGDAANGMFGYTGFRPSFLLYKNASDTSDWCLVDSTLSPINPLAISFHPNRDEFGELPAATTFDVDFLSNGFKIRGTNNNMNANGDTFVWACFAENPFGGNNVSPATGR